MWRIFIGLNGVTLLYAFAMNGDAIGVNNVPFRIHNFVSHLASYGFDIFSPVARMGSYDFRTNQAVPPETFGEIVMRWWGTDGERCSEGTCRCGEQPWTFWELWARMHEMGFGIPNTPY